MESRIQRIFLVGVLLITAATTSLWANAEETKSANDDELEKIITPDLERRTIKESDLDTENFELGLYYGLLSIEDFGTNEVSGVTFAYHITERFFTEAAFGISKLQKTSFEILSQGLELLTDEQRDLSYYNLALGYNVLPGQVYVTKNFHFDTNIYFLAGAGNTHFADKNYFTYNFGAGLKFYSTDWLSIDLSLREYSFTHDLFGKDKDTNNLEGRLGVAIFF